jgi:IclR family acetate operon transcriptional repressor
MNERTSAFPPVKSAGRTIELFEEFARAKRPLSLSEIAAALKMPMSSGSGLVRTLEAAGYLYALRQRGGFYPTKRLLEVATAIAANDPLLERTRPLLTALRDETGETVLFGKRQDTRIVYLEAFDSPHRIRYSAQAGELRDLHSNSMGKALLARLPAAERAALLARLSFQAHTPHTMTDAPALERSIAEGQARGWFLNRAESVADVMAIGAAVVLNGEPYGVSLVGPIQRVEPQLGRHAAALRRTCALLEEQR